MKCTTRGMTTVRVYFLTGGFVLSDLKSGRNTSMIRPSAVSMNSRNALLCCVLFLLALASAAAKAKSAVTGDWGGEHVSLQTSDKGAALELDCAHGEITKPIKPDAHGRFNVPGAFTMEHGGPVMRDEKQDSAPARYSGQVKDDTMMLTVMRGREKIGTYTLKRGEAPKLMKCK